MVNFFSLLLQKISFIIIISTSSILIPTLGLTDSLPPQILKSVVSLLPEWPGSPLNSKEPEATAVAILPGGYLATNDHVINQAKLVKVKLNDGRVFTSKIVGRDSLTDLALLKIPLDLPVLPLGNRPSLGDRLCAIGNQFGLGLSVTCGVASALHRTGTGFNPIEDFIQTDAVVNPGGSGGALINSQGNLVGIISAIFTKNSDANIGVNFAASTDLVMRVVREIKEKGRVIRGNPGFKVRNLSINERQKYVGVLVTQVSLKGPANVAGLKVGDLIKKIDKRKISQISDIPSVLHMVRPGTPLTIHFFREGENRISNLIIGR